MSEETTPVWDWEGLQSTQRDGHYGSKHEKWMFPFLRRTGRIPYGQTEITPSAPSPPALL